MKKKSFEAFCTQYKNSQFFTVENPLRLIGENLIDKEFITYSKNEYIYHKGEPATGVFCVYAGDIKIFKPGQTSRDIVIHRASAGEIFGFNSIANGCFTNSAKAMETTDICFVPLSEMHRLIRFISSTTELILSSKC